MTKDVIECYDTFNTKICPDKLIFGDFHDQPIPPGCYYFLNHNDDDDNNNPETPVEDVFTDNEGVEYKVIINASDDDANEKVIGNDTVTYDADSLTSYKPPSKTKSWKYK